MDPTDPYDGDNPKNPYQERTASYLHAISKRVYKLYKDTVYSDTAIEACIELGFAWLTKNGLEYVDFKVITLEKSYRIIIIGEGFEADSEDPPHAA